MTQFYMYQIPIVCMMKEKVQEDIFVCSEKKTCMWEFRAASSVIYLAQLYRIIFLSISVFVKFTVWGL